MKKIYGLLFIFVGMTATAQHFTKEEKALIHAGNGKQKMKVIQFTEPSELIILKSASKDISPNDKDLQVLLERMYQAVTDPEEGGVGIAAPQVGINRNVIWVQRFDKEGEPFEAYINPVIIWRSKLLRKGNEGCLSIPDRSGEVYRNYTIRLTYQDTKGNKKEEIIEGFTAVIFQHETDHLHGILFTDRLEEQSNKHYHNISSETALYLEDRLKRQ
ncbi:peptide deformylase [Flavobacterium cerinum]|uniref:Peptide deformylase n=1 Tax=Flavobacterium cerinum TaxID=2502784 RepID=A0ABY5IPU3_9FLAO|nr:peptide deformylase [Flavobacterium cerinum]UUC44270.1 peptide deformylase [Flavobacterium cerinum]